MYNNNARIMSRFSARLQRMYILYVAYMCTYVLSAIYICGSTPDTCAESALSLQCCVFTVLFTVVMKCTRAPYDTLNEDPLFFRRARCSRYLRKERQRAQLWCCAGVVVFLLLLLAVVAVILVVTLAATLPLGDSGCSIEASLQVNCIPEGGEAETKDICLKRGCCWSDKGDAPKCFYPAGFGYKASGSVIDTPTGKTVNLTRKSDQPSQYGGDVESLRVDVLYDTPYRLHVKVCGVCVLGG